MSASCAHSQTRSSDNRKGRSMASADDAEKWLSQVSLAVVFAMLRDNGVTEVLYKVLPKNANSKNQVYLAADFSQLGKIPMGEVTAHVSVSRKNGEADLLSAVSRGALFRLPARMQECAERVVGQGEARGGG